MNARSRTRARLLRRYQRARRAYIKNSDFDHYDPACLALAKERFDAAKASLEEFENGKN